MSRKQAYIACCIILMMLMSSCGSNANKTSEDSVTSETTEAVVEELDTTSPIIELATDTVAFYEGDEYDPMAYVDSVTDDSGEKIEAKYDDSDVIIASPGEYVITYSATDSAGNSAEKQLDFKVKKEYTRDEI